MAHELPKLPYDFAALEPHIDAQTMQIHHGKHHQAYVTNLNTALEKYPDLQGKSVDELCRGINSVPEAIRTAVRNNGGGHWNHSKFWTWMAPNAGGAPTGKVADAIKAAPPGKLKASGTGQGGIWHLALIGWLVAMGLKPDHVAWVPSNSAAPGMQDLAAGGIDIVTCSVPEARAMIDAGKAKSLAIMASAWVFSLRSSRS